MESLKKFYKINMKTSESYDGGEWSGGFDTELSEEEIGLLRKIFRKFENLQDKDIEYDEDGMRCEEPAFSVVNFSIKEREVK